MDTQYWRASATEKQRKDTQMWKDDLKNYLAISKEGVPVDKLNEMLDNDGVGQIPFAKLGFKHLNHFLFECGDFLQIGKSYQGQLFLFIKQSKVPSELDNLAQLVKGQERSKGTAKNPRPLRQQIQSWLSTYDILKHSWWNDHARDYQPPPKHYPKRRGRGRNNNIFKGQVKPSYSRASTSAFTVNKFKRFSHNNDSGSDREDELDKWEFSGSTLKTKDDNNDWGPYISVDMVDNAKTKQHTTSSSAGTGVAHGVISTSAFNSNSVKQRTSTFSSYYSDGVTQRHCSTLQSENYNAEKCEYPLRSGSMLPSLSSILATLNIQPAAIDSPSMRTREVNSNLIQPVLNSAVKKLAEQSACSSDSQKGYAAKNQPQPIANNIGVRPSISQIRSSLNGRETSIRPNIQPATVSENTRPRFNFSPLKQSSNLNAPELNIKPNAQPATVTENTRPQNFNFSPLKQSSDLNSSEINIKPNVQSASNTEVTRPQSFNLTPLKQPSNLDSSEKIIESIQLKRPLDIITQTETVTLTSFKEAPKPTINTVVILETPYVPTFKQPPTANSQRTLHLGSSISDSRPRPSSHRDSNVVRILRDPEGPISNNVRFPFPHSTGYRPVVTNRGVFNNNIRFNKENEETTKIDRPWSVNTDFLKRTLCSDKKFRDSLMKKESESSLTKNIVPQTQDLPTKSTPTVLLTSNVTSVKRSDGTCDDLEMPDETKQKPTEVIGVKLSPISLKNDALFKYANSKISENKSILPQTVQSTINNHTADSISGDTISSVPSKKIHRFVQPPKEDAPHVKTFISCKVMEMSMSTKDFKFMVCDNSKINELRVLEKNMAFLYDEDEDYKIQDGYLEPGCYGVFIPEWDKWVRCHIRMTIKPDLEQFPARLIDYAVYKVVTRKNCRYMSEAFYDFAPQSYRAKLDPACPETHQQLQDYVLNQVMTFAVTDVVYHAPSEITILTLKVANSRKWEQLCSAEKRKDGQN